MITVHHLVNSRSDRILWLLEELDVPYTLETYARNEMNRAPAELAKVHPLGKAPAIHDGEQLVTESGAIVDYLLIRYGGGRLRPADDSPELAAYLEWMHFAEGTAMAQFVMALFLSGEILPGIEPHALAPVVADEVEKLIAYVDRRLEESDYLAGPEFSAADIMMGWVVFMFEARGKLEDRAATSRYLRRLESRPAYQRMCEKR